MDARRHRLTVHNTTESAVITGDQKRLVQILANVLNNAAKYTIVDGNIVLTVTVDNERVTFTVADDGIGMEPHVIDRVFDMFAQGERNSDRSQGGLGIGLAIVKSLVTLHGGSVSAYSPGLGKGSTFKVTLPRTLDTLSPLAPVSTEPPSATKSHRLLIVDDNVDAAVMLGDYLEIMGYTVTVAHSAKAALDLIAIETPQACLLDIGLPDMDGSELAQRLRARPETASSLMIAITGYGQDSDRQKSQAAGFDYHLVKPVELPQLLTILSALH
jgi:CheY-like chemotaxis protein